MPVDATTYPFPQLTLAEGAAPSTPGTGEGLVYEKTDGKLYFKNDAGTEYDLTTATPTAADVSIADVGGYFAGTTVEAALQELGAGGGGGGGGVTWSQVVSEDGTSFANFTAASGTWAASGGTINQTDTGASWRRAKYNTRVPFGFPVIMEAKITILTASGRGGFGIADSSGNQGGVSIHLQAGTGVNVDRDNLATVRTITATVNTSTQYKLRVAVNGIFASIYLDGSLIGTANLLNTTSYDADTEYFTLLTYAASVQFDDVKVWVLTGDVPA